MIRINEEIKTARAFAPATCANVAVGFDILGFALQQVGDCVTLTRRDDNKMVIENIQSKETLPTDTDKNTASFVIKKLCEDFKLDLGFSLNIEKGIPLSSGMGGSAASAVAALVAFNAFLEPALSREQLAHYALFGEAVASGQAHPDNIVPCLWGGLTLIHSVNPIGIVELPIPDVFCVLVHPHLHVSTKEARKVLTEKISLKDSITQSANLATFISSLYQTDINLLQKSLQDVLIEHQRAHFVPGFYDVKNAAVEAGALGVSFSGSGPSIFAFAKTEKEAEGIREAMVSQLQTKNIDTDSWISPISKEPARML